MTRYGVRVEGSIIVENVMTRVEANPKRLFHFVSNDYGLKDLREKRLKIARILDLNDPFEFRAVNLSDKDFRESYERALTHLSDRNGIICCSGHFSSPLQWSHYADSHKGLCLEFEAQVLPRARALELRKQGATIIDIVNSLSGVNFFPVYYEGTLAKRPGGPGELEDFAIEMVYRKFADWKYEDEYRGIIQIDPDAVDDGHYFIDFSNEFVLKSVTIGSKSETTRNQICDALGVHVRGVEIFRAELSRNSFEIVRFKNL